MCTGHKTWEDGHQTSVLNIKYVYWTS